MAFLPKLSKKHYSFTLASIASAACWYCAIVVLALVLYCSVKVTHDHTYDYECQIEDLDGRLQRACDEIYEVQQGDTLISISDKCGDSFIVENNPHITDPDDVFPGLLLKITPSRTR